MEDIRKGTCPLCAHTEIVESWPADHTGGQGTVNMAVTEHMTWKGPQLFGFLVAYFCRSCGYTQLFTSQPEQVPLGEEFRTTLLRR